MKLKKNWLCMFLTLLIFTLNSIPVLGETNEQENHDLTLAPYFYIEGADPSSVDHFPLKETDVTTNINGVIAETYVTQVYANEGEDVINASYVFPASTRVTVHGMKMEIGNQVVTATIKEKEEAKQEFEAAKSEGKSASLLEQERPNVFSMNVANIMPGDTVRIELHYTELIVPTDGIYQYVFPTVVGPRYAGPAEDDSDNDDSWVAAPYLKDGKTPAGEYNITVNLATGVPITDLASKSHQVDVNWNHAADANVTLTNPKEYAGNRDFILDYKLTGQEVRSGFMLNTGETENFFMLTIQPPERFNAEAIPPREYVFVLDVSGSMEGYPLDTAKDLIRDLVTNLRETDSFNLILFSNEFTQLAPESLPATTDNIKKAVDFIDQQFGGGGTELAPALTRAIELPTNDRISRSIVIITDGYLSGEAEIFDLIDENLSATSFFSFGIGTSVNHYLIDGIAKAGLGESFTVTDSEDAAKTAERFRTYIQSPILTDIQVSYQGVDAYDIEPAVLPTLFAQRPIVLLGKWRGEPTGTITITGKTGDQDYLQEIPLAEVTATENSDAIRYLWARKRVERLTDYGGYHDEEAIKKEVTELGLNYSMMTRYTSFVAVIDTIRNPDGNSTDVDQPLPLPLHVSDLAVGGGYTIGSEPGTLILVFGTAMILFASFLFQAKKRKSIAVRGRKDEDR